MFVVANPNVREVFGTFDTQDEAIANRQRIAELSLEKQGYRVGSHTESDGYDPYEEELQYATTALVVLEILPVPSAEEAAQHDLSEAEKRVLELKAKLEAIVNPPKNTKRAAKKKGAKGVK